MEFYGCIYGLRSPSCKWYIGQTTAKNPLQYIDRHYKYRSGGDRTKLKHALQKYGFKSFSVKIFVYLFDQESLNTCEIYFIQELNSIVNGYNLTEGGKNGKKSEETKVKISLAHTGKVVSEETKAKISMNHVGTKGMKFSEEWKKNISESTLGRVFSEDTIQRMKDSHIKYEYEIQCPDGSIVLIKNISEFSKINNLSKSTICKMGACNGFTCLSRKDLYTGEIVVSKKKRYKTADSVFILSDQTTVDDLRIINNG